MNNEEYNFGIETLNDYMSVTTPYDKYLKEHIGNVKTAFNWLIVNLPDLFVYYDVDELGEWVVTHDSSKWDEDEYLPYAVYFNGDKTAEDRDKVEEAFDYAWLHHIHNNPHHWQYWLLQEDEGNAKALQMPFKYVVHMIADWWSFSWKSGNLYEIFEWYEEHKKKMILHEETKKLVEMILEKMYDTLDKIGDTTDYD